MLKRKCKIIFVHHGATIYSDENRLSDKSDYPPLNEAGREEIIKLVELLKQRSPKNDKILTSPSTCAVQAARIIAKGYEKDFEIIDNLYKKKVGIWNGLSFEQIEKKYPDMLKKYHEDAEHYTPEGGESIADFNKRIEETISEIVKNNIEKRLILVTHGNIIQAVIAKALNIPPQYQSRIIIPTGSATQINYYDGWQTLVYSGYVPL